MKVMDIHDISFWDGVMMGIAFTAVFDRSFEFGVLPVVYFSLRIILFYMQGVFYR